MARSDANHLVVTCCVSSEFQDLCCKILRRLSVPFIRSIKKEEREERSGDLKDGGEIDRGSLTDAKAALVLHHGVDATNGKLKASTLRFASSLSLTELADGFCALRNGVFGEFSWQNQPHCRLHLPRRDGAFFVVLCQVVGLHDATQEGGVSECEEKKKKKKETSLKTREKQSSTKCSTTDIAFLLMPVSGWTCLRTL